MQYSSDMNLPDTKQQLTDLKAAGLTQKLIALEIDTSQSSISMLNQGRVDMKVVHNIIKINNLHKKVMRKNVKT